MPEPGVQLDIQAEIGAGPEGPLVAHVRDPWGAVEFWAQPIRGWNGGLQITSASRRAPVDSWRMMSPREWEMEFGGLASWRELLAAVREALKESPA